MIKGKNVNLNLDSLKEMGSFTGAPVEREITWRQGDKELTATVFVRPLSYHSARADVVSSFGKVDGVAGRIAACICDEHGKPVFTPQDITDGPVVLDDNGEPVLDDDGLPKRTGGALDGNLTMALLSVIGEVSGAGKT